MIVPAWRPHLPSARQHPCMDGPDRPSILAENAFGLHATACGTEYAISAPFSMPRQCASRRLQRRRAEPKRRCGARRDPRIRQSRTRTDARPQPRTPPTKHKDRAETPRPRNNPLLLIRIKGDPRSAAILIMIKMGTAIVTESRDFHFGSRLLSVRAVAFNGGWRVRVFDGDRPATDVVYTVAHENTADASMASMQLVDGLMTVAQDDIEEGRVKLIPRTSPY
jgi:hypothetical protein